MKKGILIVLAVLACFYGVFVLQAGAGTKFWLIWEGIGAGCILWAILLHKDFFSAHKVIKRIFYTMILVGILGVTFLLGLIGSEFRAKGEANLEYVIVLGAQVKENGPSTILRYRLDTAIQYMNENPDTICIVSGGRGVNEPWSEAEGMFRYMTAKGISEDRILLEETSASTVENVRNSKKLMSSAEASVGIVTNNFHVFRAVQIARKEGLEQAQGIAGASHPLYLPNNVLRECFGIVKDWAMKNLRL